MNRKTAWRALAPIVLLLAALLPAGAAHAGPGPVPTPPPTGRCERFRVEGGLISYYRCLYDHPSRTVHICTPNPHQPHTTPNILGCERASDLRKRHFRAWPIEV